MSSADQVWETELGQTSLAHISQPCLLPAAEACVEPQITPSYYTTSDAVISTETVFIVEISLTCKNRVQVRQWGFSQKGVSGDDSPHWKFMESDPWAMSTGRIRIPVLGV